MVRKNLSALNPHSHIHEMKSLVPILRPNDQLLPACLMDHAVTPAALCVARLRLQYDHIKAIGGKRHICGKIDLFSHSPSKDHVKPSF